MGALLFNPSGRVGPNDFRSGAVILLILNVILWMGWKIGLGVGTLAMFIALASMYCWACLYIKRFHDAGKSGWLFLPVLIGFGVSSYIIGSILLAIIAPELVEIAQSLQQTTDPQNPDLSVVLPIYRDVFNTISLPFAVAYLLAGGMFAYGVNMVLQSDPKDNHYGPAAR